MTCINDMHALVCPVFDGPFNSSFPDLSVVCDSSPELMRKGSSKRKMRPSNSIPQKKAMRKPGIVTLLRTIAESAGLQGI